MNMQNSAVDQSVCLHRMYFDWLWPLNKSSCIIYIYLWKLFITYLSIADTGRLVWRKIYSLGKLHCINGWQYKCWAPYLLARICLINFNSHLTCPQTEESVGTKYCEERWGWEDFQGMPSPLTETCVKEDFFCWKYLA